MESVQSPPRQCRGSLRRSLALVSRKSQIFCWHGESKHMGEHCSQVMWFLLTLNVPQNLSSFR